MILIFTVKMRSSLLMMGLISQVLIEQDRLYFDTESARHTFLLWLLINGILLLKPKPIHDWASHPCDAVRYAIYTHQKMSNITIYA